MVTSERESSVLPTQSKIAHNLYLTQKKVYLACGTDIKRQRTSEQARPPLRKAKNEHLCDDLPLVLSRRDGWHKRLPRRDDRLFPFEAVQVDRVAPDLLRQFEHDLVLRRRGRSGVGSVERFGVDRDCKPAHACTDQSRENHQSIIGQSGDQTHSRSCRQRTDCRDLRRPRRRLFVRARGTKSRTGSRSSG